MKNLTKQNEWTTIIRPKMGWLDVDIKDIIRHKDLIWMFVKRNFVVYYKQTVLGPLWFVINPLLTTFVFSFIFGTVAKISTNGVPQFLFYLSGNTIWAYFASCLNETSGTFIKNSHIFGKVYFPRIVMPISTSIFGLTSFFVQYLMFLCILIYSLILGKVHPNMWILITPLLIIQSAILGLGVGIIISALTTKYRDLQMLVGFGVTLWMFITPVVYSIDTVPQNLRIYFMLNPMTPILEMFRYAYFGVGNSPGFFLIISACTSILVLLFGIFIFSRVEKTFMDTI